MFKIDLRGMNLGDGFALLAIMAPMICWALSLGYIGGEEKKAEAAKYKLERAKVELEKLKIEKFLFLEKGKGVAK